MKYKRFLTLLFVCFSTITWAQPDLPGENVEVIKDFEAQLEESEILTIQPELPPLDTSTQTLVYNVAPKVVGVNYLPPKLKPIAMKRDRVDPGYKGYLKAGFGNPGQPLAELGYHHFNAPKFEIGGKLRYHSGNGNDLENQRFRQIGGAVNGTYYDKAGFAVGGDLGYQNNQVHFYGVDPEFDTLARESVRQVFSTFDAAVRLFNGEKTQGDINYRAEARLYTHSDDFASSETGFVIDLLGSKWFSEKHLLNVGIITDFTSFDDTTNQALNNFFIQPNFTYRGDSYKVKVGANVASHDDNFYFYPDIEAAVQVLGSQLQAFAGANGGLYKNNFRNLTEYNPFLVSRFELVNSFNRYYYGGVNGNIKGISYRGEVGFNQVDNLALFVNDFSGDEKRFLPVYDTANIVVIQGSIDAQVIDGVRVNASLTNRVYSLENNEKRW